MNSFLMCLSTNCLLWRIIASALYEWLTTFLQGGAKISLHYYNAHVCKMFFCFWKLLLLNSALQFTIYNDDTKREKNLQNWYVSIVISNLEKKYLKAYDFFLSLFNKKKGLRFLSRKFVKFTYPEIDANKKSIRVIQSLNTLSAKVKLTWQATTIAQTDMYVGIYICWWVQIVHKGYFINSQNSISVS